MFLNLVQLKNNIVIRTRGPQKRVIFLTFSHEVFGYFPHIIMLFYIKMIRKFIYLYIYFLFILCSKVKSFYHDRGRFRIYLHVLGVIGI